MAMMERKLIIGFSRLCFVKPAASSNPTAEWRWTNQITYILKKWKIEDHPGAECLFVDSSLKLSDQVNAIRGEGVCAPQDQSPARVPVPQNQELSFFASNAPASRTISLSSTEHL
jgi:hypothetical protein